MCHTVTQCRGWSSIHGHGVHPHLMCATYMRPLCVAATTVQHAWPAVMLVVGPCLELLSLSRTVASAIAYPLCALFCMLCMNAISSAPLILLQPHISNMLCHWLWLVQVAALSCSGRNHGSMHLLHYALHGVYFSCLCHHAVYAIMLPCWLQSHAVVAVGGVRLQACSGYCAETLQRQALLL